MASDQGFHETSYERHQDHYDSEQADDKAEEWLNDGSVDAWRHQRMYRTLDPILEADPDARWLTIGDGRFGMEAQYILNHGCEALPTDISTELLAEAEEMGLIPEYQQENAEALSFDDGSFDYVFCKESYHHFPRPMLALYEMLRVARKGVVLIEPSDSFINAPLGKKLLDAAAGLADRSIGPGRFEFEESGNYKYTLSRREMEKAALGLNYDTVAFKGINDVYVSGVEDEQLSEDGPLQRKVRRWLTIKGLLCRFGFMNHSLLTAAIFKSEPPEPVRNGLSEADYDIVDLPDNPYI
ncbi:class I SAM-dependent methyltransferase [Haloplanus halobius]|uniref:class I SAM-dependent methyltransferase n=1 Tax=Haloplanus halobius TaxID=2934938 RepID=UPI00200C4AF5|nr:class I SAM-dependent methyltransferase [Haloplanus sp. XH21]